MNLQIQTVITLEKKKKNQQIDIKKLPAGLYFLAAKKDDGESMKLKFVKF